MTLAVILIPILLLAQPEPQRPEFEAIADRIRNSRNPYLGMLQIDDYQQAIDAGIADPYELAKTHVLLATELMRVGRNEEASDHIELAFDVFPGEPPSGYDHLRALINLRLAEVQNCIDNHNADCCIFPLAGGGVHINRDPALKARAGYIDMIGKERSLRAAWLLNIVAMALGEYPEGLPNILRIPMDSFESTFDVGRFKDVAPQLGLDSISLCGGCIVDDFDGDDRLDLVTSSYDFHTPLQYFRNAADAGFEDRSHASFLDDQLGGLNINAADYDNDGDLDILVLRGAWLYDDGQIRNSLLRNDDAVFTDVTRAAGLAEPACPTQTAVWLDYDNDADLDLYIGNESRSWEDAGDYPNQLFRNNADGTFTDVARQAGVANDSYCKGVAAGDYDNDGDMDIYVSNIGPNRLYRNNADGTFTDVAPSLGVTQPEQRSFATWFFDVDNDGWLDIFVAAYDAKVEDIAAEALGIPFNASFPTLYHNNADGTFTDVAGDMGLHHPYLPMGANFGDLDNDGFLDIYLGTGDPSFESLMPNVMLRNDRGVAFQDVTVSGGFGHLQKGHGIAFADIDEDGDQDIYHQLGGFYPGDMFRNALFENPGHGNHYLHLTLVGTASNRDAVGARVTVDIDTPDGARSIHRAVGSISSFGGSPRRQEIGLANATALRKLTVRWPSGKIESFDDLPLDASVRIVEGTEKVEPLDLRPAPFKNRLPESP